MFLVLLHFFLFSVLPLSNVCGPTYLPANVPKATSSTQLVAFGSFEEPRVVKKVQGLPNLTGRTKLVIEIHLDFRNINISHNVRNTRTSTCQREHT